MNKIKDIENAIMAFGPFLGHGWIARELTEHFEEEKETDINSIAVEPSPAKTTRRKVANSTRTSKNPELKLS